MTINEPKPPTMKVELSIDKAMEWQANSRNDEMTFAMSLMHFFIEEGFLVNPHPDHRQVDVTGTSSSIIFEKVKTDGSEAGG